MTRTTVPNYLPSPATIEAARARLRESKLQQFVAMKIPFNCRADHLSDKDFCADEEALADVERILADGTQATAEDLTVDQVFEVPPYCERRISIDSTDDDLIALADEALRLGRVWMHYDYVPTRSELIEALIGYRTALKRVTPTRLRRATEGKPPRTKGRREIAFERVPSLVAEGIVDPFEICSRIVADEHYPTHDGKLRRYVRECLDELGVIYERRDGLRREVHRDAKWQQADANVKSDEADQQLDDLDQVPDLGAPELPAESASPADELEVTADAVDPQQLEDRGAIEVELLVDVPSVDDVDPDPAPDLGAPELLDESASPAGELEVTADAVDPQPQQQLFEVPQLPAWLVERLSLAWELVNAAGSIETATQAIAWVAYLCDLEE